MNQYSVTFKQKYDGQIHVVGIKVPLEVLRENPWIKNEIKRKIEDVLTANYIRVLPDVGIIEYD